MDPVFSGRRSLTWLILHQESFLSVKSVTARCDRVGIQDAAAYSVPSALLGFLKSLRANRGLAPQALFLRRFGAFAIWQFRAFGWQSRESRWGDGNAALRLPALHELGCSSRVFRVLAFSSDLAIDLFELVQYVKRPLRLLQENLEFGKAGMRWPNFLYDEVWICVGSLCYLCVNFRCWDFDFAGKNARATLALERGGLVAAAGLDFYVDVD